MQKKTTNIIKTLGLEKVPPSEHHVARWEHQSFKFATVEYLSIYENRNQAGKSAAKIALKKVLNRFDDDSIKIINHHHLKNNPNVLISLSHTQNIGSAIINHQTNNILSIGIDIELANRKVNPRTTKFFINLFDDQNLFLPLQLWCIKEAAFKAIYPVAPKTSRPLVLKQINIINHHVFTCNIINNSNEIKEFKGLFHLENIKLNNKNLILAYAYLNNPK